MTYPNFPQQPQFPQQQFAQPAPVQYPPQHSGYPAQPQYAPQPPVPAGPPPAQGSLTDFFNQPSVGGGPSWSWKNKPIGTQYVGIVERAIRDGDIKADTQPNSNIPATFQDGRQKFTMWVPMLVQPDQSFPDGHAQWPVSGGARDELVRAMAAAGVPAEQIEAGPEAGAVIRVTLVNRVPTKFPQPRNVFQVEYARPDGAASAPAPAPVQEAAPVVQPAPVAQPQPAAAPVQAQPVAPAPAVPLAPPEGMSPEKAQLLARLLPNGGAQTSAA